jgi:hypothetical protein
VSKLDFPNTAAVANRYGQEAVRQMKQRLIREGKGGGSLEKSIRYRVYYPEGEVLVKFFMDKSADYVEAGRRAYGDNRRHDPPVVKRWASSPLRKWMISKSIEEKYKYAIAREIGRRGIQPFKFRYVTSTLFKQYEKQYETAMAKDLELQLQKFINETFKR